MLKHKIIAYLTMILAFVANTLNAANPVFVKTYINPKDWSFVENKGQLADQNCNPITEVKFYSHSGGAQICLRPGLISFVFTRMEIERPSLSEATGESTLFPAGWGRGWKGDLEREITRERVDKITTNRIDLTLLNANPSATIIPSAKQEYYENFYLAHTPEQGITNVHSFKTITYQNIYPHIDMMLQCKPSGLKYSFIVHPGGKISDIQMQWNGLNEIKQLENGGISYAFGLGMMEEGRPASLQEGYEINSRFVRKGNRVGFRVGSYNNEKDLVIDPTLIWSTYFGGPGYETSTGVATDKSGNVYVAGYTASRSGIATSGSYQSVFAGNVNYDGFLAKFNDTGAIKWATYCANNMEINNIAVDLFGNIYLVGETGTTSGIATAGAYQTSSGGSDDAFLAKFNTSGSLIWSTYYGGMSADRGYGIACDGSGNIYITGYTESLSGIATSGVYQTNFKGAKDAFLAKFNGIGALLWATYFGGNYYDEGMCISADASGVVYLAGQTNSTRGIATPGAHQPYFGNGTSDGFLAQFDDKGTLIWATYYGGTDEDICHGVATDHTGNVYITGSTISANGIATSGAFQTTQRNDEGFLSKFNSGGELQWGTYFGGIWSDFSCGIAIDAFDHIYITGYTGNSPGLATNGAYQTSSGGGIADEFLAEFNNGGNRLWATYFGGEDIEQAWGGLIAIDPSGNIYITALTQSTKQIATKGAYQTVYSGQCDAFLAKFGALKSNFDAGIVNFLSPSGSRCPGKGLVIVKMKNFGKFEIDSINIGYSINGKVQQPLTWFGKLLPDSTTIISLGTALFDSGNDTLIAWTSGPNGTLDSVPKNDSMTAYFTIYALPKASAGPDTLLCYDQIYTMQGAGGITYLWKPAIYLSSAIDPNAKAKLPNTELYTLIVSNSQGCSDSSTVLLKVRPKPVVKAFASADTICYRQKFTLQATGHGGDSLHYLFSWPDDNASGDTITVVAVKSGWHKVILNDNCSPDQPTDSVYVYVVPPAKAAFAFPPGNPVLIKKTVNFLNQSQNSASWLWTFDTKDSSRKKSPSYIYTDTGYYKVILIAYGLNGCQNDTTFGTIKVIDGTVTIYIPNIFTPNGDGHNDSFDIKGTGIKDYTYSIYNRWGELIFVANNTGQRSPSGDLGVWDGTFKGAQVPEGVYIYMVTVTDIFDEKHYLSGTITIVR